MLGEEHDGEMNANRQNPTSVIASTIWGEARGEGEEGMRAVASVIHYGANQKDRGLVMECLRPWRYSCWKDEVFQQKSPPVDGVVWDKCIEIATELIYGTFKPLFVASHYFNPDLVPGRWPKSWKRERMQFVKKVGHHEFYLEVTVR